MNKDEINQQIDDLFVKDKTEVLSAELENMAGWFYFDKDELGLSPQTHQMAKKWQYLSFLTAAFVADFRELRNTSEVKHKEANDYFGWSNGNGRSAKDYASAISKYITDGEKGKKIPPGKLRKVVEKIEDEMPDE